MSRPLPSRVLATAIVAAATIASAVLAAALTPGSVGAVNAGVEALSSTSSGVLDRLASLLPLGFAFGAGMVSAVNPCGFAMLPAYLGLYLRGDAGRAASTTQRVGRALRVGGAVTAGFVALFGVAGAVLAASPPWSGRDCSWSSTGRGWASSSRC